MEPTEIGKKLARIEELMDNLTHLQSMLLKSDTASHVQSIRLQVNHLTKCIKSNIHSIHSLLMAQVHKVTLYDADSNQTTTIHVANATEDEIRRYFKLQKILFGKGIEILEIKKIPSQIRDS